MNSKQVSTINHITNNIRWISKKFINGDLIFAVEEIGNNVLVFVKTENTHWSSKRYLATIKIGPRGGFLKMEETVI